MTAHSTSSSTDRPRSGTTAPPFPRELFELQDVLWLMHCADGPAPKAAARAIQDFMLRETQPWKLRWEEFESIPRRTRRLAAAVLSAAPDDITLTSTTSSGLVTVAQGLTWKAGDEVVIPLGEFPANVWPWLALRQRGVKLRQVPLWAGHRAGSEAWSSEPPPAGVRPEDALLAAIGPQTRLLAVSWVRFQDGLKLDLPRLAAGAAERQVLLVVDGIQGAGTHPVPLDGLAAFATGGHKGLLTPQGIGLLWTSEALRQQLVPSGSWLSVEQAADFSRPSTDFQRPWVNDGRRLEPGVPNLVGCAALGASLELIRQAGVERIASHVNALQGSFLRRLRDLPAWRAEAERLHALLARNRLGPILGLHHGTLGAVGCDRLLRAGFRQRIYASVREGYLRIAFHGWHEASDLEKILRWLAVPPDRHAG